VTDLVSTAPARGIELGRALRIETGATVAGLDPDALVAGHGSPLFVYDVDVIRARAASLRAALPGPAEVAFAVKANPSPAILAALAAEGLGADVASGGELRAVLRAGFEAGRVVFTGPGKTDAELAAALEAGVGGLTLESLDELEALIGMRVAARAGQGLLLRLATHGEGERTPIIGGDASAKFGLTDAEADEALERLRGAGALAPQGPFHLRGFHAFGASNVSDAAVLVAGVRRLAERAEALAARHGPAVELLDAGGGLGIPYADDEEPLDLDALGAGLAAEQATWAHRPALRGARLLLEPGRWLTGPAGAYLCRVVRTKEREGRLVAVTDGGIHHLLRPRLVGQDHRIVPVGQAATRAAREPTDVVGPLCTGLDYLALHAPLPRVRRGDLLAVLDAGAYGFSESMPFFLSHPIPAEVVLERGRVTVSRPRVEPA
jgi:diaminopimelate decarboxylase